MFSLWINPINHPQNHIKKKINSRKDNKNYFINKFAPKIGNRNKEFSTIFYTPIIWNRFSFFLSHFYLLLLVWRQLSMKLRVVYHKYMYYVCMLYVAVLFGSSFIFYVAFIFLWAIIATSGAIEWYFSISISLSSCCYIFFVTPK